jgi:subtilisin family serine protease
MVYINNGMAPTFEPFIAADSRINSLPAALGHGTMVAGAVRLVAPNAQIFPIRAFGQDGYGRLYNVIRAIHAAEDRGCKVLSMSFNTYQHSAELDRSIQEVSARGVVIIASTGNDGLTDVDSYPASISTVTGVASVYRHLVRSSFSNAGQTLTWVAAPGEALLLPWPGNRWGGAWGTSFSAPQVSGLAAKILAFNAFATYSDLQSALGRSRDVGQADLGKGFLDVFESVNGL